MTGRRAERADRKTNRCATAVSREKAAPPGLPDERDGAASGQPSGDDDRVPTGTTPAPAAAMWRRCANRLEAAPPPPSDSQHHVPSISARSGPKGSGIPSSTPYSVLRRGARFRFGRSPTRRSSRCRRTRWRALPASGWVPCSRRRAVGRGAGARPGTSRGPVRRDGYVGARLIGGSATGVRERYFRQHGERLGTHPGARDPGRRGTGLKPRQAGRLMQRLVGDRREPYRTPRSLACAGPPHLSGRLNRGGQGALRHSGRPVLSAGLRKSRNEAPPARPG